MNATVLPAPGAAGLHPGEPGGPSLPALCLKTAVVHSITYTIMGMLAMWLLNYREMFARPEMVCWMRQLDDPVIMAGPLAQPVRGAVFALAFYPLRGILFGRKTGYLLMFWLLFALGILSPFSAGPGSLEGVVYTRIPLAQQFVGWLEIVPQSFLLSALLYRWVTRPQRWLNWTLGTIFVVLMTLPVLGLLTRR